MYIDSYPCNIFNFLSNSNSLSQSASSWKTLIIPEQAANPGSTALNTNCLAVLNGVCTKRNTAWFELLLSEKEVNNNLQTWPLIHLKGLATFYSKTLLLRSELCRWKNIMKMNKMANFSFRWYSHNASWYLLGDE